MPRAKKSDTAPLTTTQQLGSLIKSARDIMRKDKGLSTDIDRLPMLTWVMFLKFLDDMERLEEERAELAGEEYRPAIEPPYRWRDWAAPSDGITGDELTAFISYEDCLLPDGMRGPGLLPYLRSLQGVNGDGAKRRNVIGAVFKDVQNRMMSGYLLRDVINKVNGIHFLAKEELFTLGHMYETMLREMRDAAGQNGEFYTPRPVVRFMVAVTDPKLGETVLDPACGTGGFLAEVYQHLEAQCQTVEDRRTLQEASLYGGEAKPLPYLLCQMNLLLHGLEAPQIDPGNSLRFKLSELGDKDRVDVILTNPPFGGEEEPGMKGNFPSDMQTSETALLFLQLIMRKLRRPGHGSATAGRAALVVPNTTLFYAGVAAAIRSCLVKDFGLCAVVRLPKGVFEPYTDIETNLLFLDRSRADGQILYYKLAVPDGRRQYSKTQPLRYEELEECAEILRLRVDASPQAWFVDARTVLQDPSVNLDLHNPKERRQAFDPPSEVLAAMCESLRKSAVRISTVADALQVVESVCSTRQAWRQVALGDVLTRRKDAIEILDEETYMRVTIRVKGRGIVVRDEAPGSEIGTKRQFRIEADQFALSKIDARNGAFGLVPEECGGAVITGNFWTYDVDVTQLSPALIHHFSQSPDFVSFCEQCSPGATNRRYLQEERFLEQVICVPATLEEQQRLAQALGIVRAAARLHETDLMAQAHVAPSLADSALHAVFSAAP